MTTGNGNTLGSRAYYRYTSDSDDNYRLLLDETVADAMGLTKNTTDPYAPRFFEPRHVWLEATVNNKKIRKKAVCQAANTSYKSESSSTITIDGVSFTVTGRVGERMSFGRNPAAQN